jgi:hypothetical protein
LLLKVTDTSREVCTTWTAGDVFAVLFLKQEVLALSEQEVLSLPEQEVLSLPEQEVLTLPEQEVLTLPEYLCSSTVVK